MTWKVRVPSSGFMKLLPLLILMALGLAMTAWVYLGARGGSNPAERMERMGLGDLSGYAGVIQVGAMVLLGGFFILFWGHRKGRLSIEGGRLVLKRRFGSRELPLERLAPSCSRCFDSRRTGNEIGVVLHPTGDASDNGLRVLGYGVSCPAELLTSPDLYGQEYDAIIMDPEDFDDFLGQVTRAGGRY